MKTRIKYIKLILLFSIIITPILLIFAYGISPLNVDYYPSDFGVFTYMGRIWSRGYVPYLDAFDHKGVLTYIIPALGELLSGSNKIAMFILDVCFHVSVCLLSYSIYKLLFNELISVGASILQFLIIIPVIGAGGSTDEYSLLITLIGIKCLLKYVLPLMEADEIDKNHPYKYAFVYGVLFMCMVFLRATNAITICCIVFCITLYLIWNRKWKNLIQNMIAFILGCLAIFLPFSIYFLVNGAFYEMLYAVIFYNIDYALITNEHFYTGLRFLLLCMPIFLLAIATFVQMLAHKKVMLINYICLMMCILNFINLYFSKRYPGYFLLVIPLVTLSLMVFKCTKYNTVKLNIFGAVLFYSFFGLTILDRSRTTILSFPGKLSNFTELSTKIDNKVFLDFVEQNKLNEYSGGGNSIAGYNLSSQYYLVSNIISCYPYFTLQDWQGSFSEELRHKIEKCFLEGKAEWIIVQGNIENPVVENYILINYTLVDSASSIGVNLYSKN